MCHQSVGLVQGAIEAAGISTVSISVRPEVTINMLVPRAVYIHFPTGNPMGEAGQPAQQRAILLGVLRALEAITQPGTVLDMPYRWKRMETFMGEISPASGRDAAQATADAIDQPELTSRSPDEDFYGSARDLVEAIEQEYVELMRSIDSYRQWLEDRISEERNKPEPDSVKLQALAPQLTYLAELQRALESGVHDGLVRVSDRVIRIRHWQDGVFI